MHQRQFAIAGGGRLVHAQLRLFTGQTITQQPVFGHRKAMARRQWQNKVVGVKGMHAQGSRAGLQSKGAASLAC